jgi:hypothetical protein
MFCVMTKLRRFAISAAMSLAVVGIVIAAVVVPNEVQQPGTQPGEVGTLETPDKCDNCHGGYAPAVEPAFNWRGSMMANAGRDPLFWATLAIAEQDFDGAGDLCLRCHSTAGWQAGHSTPTDGSALTAGDADGVDCDTCHKMTNPNNTEHLGAMTQPFVANDGSGNGYYGSGMLSLWAGSAKLGPYSDAQAKHQFEQSRFHRSVDFCGSCHDVSNPAVGDLAHNNGRQPAGDPVIASGVPGSPVGQKAAFNNFPYRYGVVERTYSEYKAGALSQTLVKNYASLPADLKAGAIQDAFDSAKGDYSDGTPRYFSCQTCHMRAVTGVGANKVGTPTRTDLPLHDLTGGSVWIPDAILYQNAQGTLRLGGGLTTNQVDALNAGRERARGQLQRAASLAVSGNTLKVTNLTAHKVISGYPEGRRMWLNVKWYDAGDNLLREDGKYGVVASVNGTPVKSLVDLADPNTKVYEAHYGMTQEWASQLLALGKPASLPLGFDRTTGAVTYTLGQLAAQAPGTQHETFHFVLNNTVVKDNRIPTYGMSHEEARKRNALPVPATQYGGGTASYNGLASVYRYWDEVALSPPAGAVRANIDLLYQSTSWEYIQFLRLANTGSVAFLANEGQNLYDAWRNTGMAEPVVMASASWVGSIAPVAPQITSPAPPDGHVGMFYTHAYTATGFPAPTFQITSGTPPPGLLLTADGVLSGTPTLAGTFSGIATATNGVAPSAVQPFSIVIVPATTVPTAPPAVSAVAGNAAATVSFSPSASDGGAPITGYTATCTPTGGMAVAGSNVGSPILVSGLTNLATYTCTVHATNALGDSPESAPSNAVTPSALPPAALSVAVAGSGTGTVTSAPPGIACPGNCGATYPGGIDVTLTATPIGGSVFTGWLGGGCGFAPICTVTMTAATTVTATFAPAGTVVTLDVDASAPASVYDALTDGLLIVRFMQGLSGPALTDGLLGANAASPDAIATYLADIRPALDIDGNGHIDPLTDGVLIVRYLFGLTGDALIQGAIGDGAKRSTATLIESHMLGLMP